MNIAVNDNITSNLLSLIYATSFNPLKSMNILNISCDVSRIYNSLIYKYKDCNIINIEMDIFYKNNLDKIPNTTLGDIHGLNTIYDENYFDLIVLDDSIQRFIDPWNVFSVLSSYIKDDGYLFASIPNIMHISAINNIIIGKFEYLDSGLFNKDNLRFFTLNEIRKLFDITGYSLVEISSISSDKTLESKAFVNRIYPNAGNDIIEQFHAYEYILKSKLKSIRTLYDYVYTK